MALGQLERARAVAVAHAAVAAAAAVGAVGAVGAAAVVAQHDMRAALDRDRDDDDAESVVARPVEVGRQELGARVDVRLERDELVERGRGI